MKAFLVTLGMIGLLHRRRPQFVRLPLYVALLAPTGSILDQRDDKADRELAALSIDELTKRYEETGRKGKFAEAGKSDDLWDPSKEPDRSRDRLRRAIETWEMQSRDLMELHYFWWAGLLCAALGVAGFRIHRWLAAALLVTGFVVMLYWTSYPIRLLGGTPEFDRLATWKLVYSALTLVLLIGAWLYLERAIRNANHENVKERKHETS